MNKIHIFSTARSGTHYLESLISGMLDISIIPTPFEERDDDNRPGSDELITKINEFSAIDSMVYKTHPNWLYPIDTSVNEFKYCNVPNDDMLPLVQQFTEVADYTIGLIRLNIVDASLSFALAFHNWLNDESETGSFRPPYKNTTVSIPMNDFIEYCHKVLAIYEVMIAQTEIQCDKIIYYEDLAFDLTDALLTGLTPIHNVKSSVKQAKSKQITIANYDELHEYAIKFFTANQKLHTMAITDGVITDINLTNLKRR
tara:strand:- start:100 stop:870 length:771 start_codon:yes stop_codon:yes gene_type:complete